MRFRGNETVLIINRVRVNDASVCIPDRHLHTSKVRRPIMQTPDLEKIKEKSSLVKGFVFELCSQRALQFFQFAFP